MSGNDAFLWYNVGDWGRFGLAIPNFSNDTKSQNDTIRYLTDVVGRNLQAILWHPDARLRTPPSINTLTQQKRLAFASKTPGRTQHINLFALGPREAPDAYLADLPGYGYAKVPMDLQAHWQAFIDRYFRTREALRGLVVVMDIRHPLKDYDLQMLGYAVRRGLPAHALLTKADKLSRSQQMQSLAAVRKELSSHFADSVSVQVFSGESKLGVDDVRGVIGSWLEMTPPGNA